MLLSKRVCFVFLSLALCAGWGVGAAAADQPVFEGGTGDANPIAVLTAKHYWKTIELRSVSDDPYPGQNDWPQQVTYMAPNPLGGVGMIGRLHFVSAVPDDGGRYSVYTVTYAGYLIPVELHARIAALEAVLASCPQPPPGIEPPSRQTKLSPAAEADVGSDGPRLVVPRQIRLPGVGSTYQLEPQVIGAEAAAYQYISEMQDAVKVSPSGEIEITGAAFCNVYVRAQLTSGEWLRADVFVVSPSAQQLVLYE